MMYHNEMRRASHLPINHCWIGEDLRGCVASNCDKRFICDRHTDGGAGHNPKTVKHERNKKADICTEHKYVSHDVIDHLRKEKGRFK